MTSVVFLAIADQQTPGPGTGDRPRAHIDLIGSNNDRIRLSDPASGLKVLARGLTGFGMPTPRLEEDVTPGVDGARPGDAYWEPRTVGLVVSLQMRSHAQMTSMVDRLARALNPKAGPCTLVLTNRDGSQRQITGRYAGGAEDGAHAKLIGEWPIELRCSDEPLFTDTPASEPPTISWKPPAPRPWYPFPGWIRPQSSRVLGGPQVVENDGDGAIYPDWLLYGPSAGLILSHLDDERVLTWNGALAAGEWLTVITRPGLQQVRDSHGTNRYFELDQVNELDFWSLNPGSNTIQAQVDGVGPETRFTLLHRRRRWLTAG